MHIPQEFDEANRESRFEKSSKKVNQLIDRLKLTLSDIQRDITLNENQVKKIFRNAEERLQNL